MEVTKYDIFISYSRKDYVDEQNNVISGNEISKIKDSLDKAGLTYWMDVKGIIPGEDYASKITKHIKACKIFIYISSVNSNFSDWTRKEIACALLYKKHIIPLLLDDSPFHDSVILRIADLDRIDYYLNPKLGLERLNHSIMTRLEELAREERSKQEEEERRKEKERKKAEEEKKKQETEEMMRLQEQQKIVNEITAQCTALNNEESKIELDRETLILSTRRLTNKDERETLISLIQNSSPIKKKVREENIELEKELEKYREQVLKLTDERDRVAELLSEKTRENDNLKRRETHLQDELEAHKSNPQFKYTTLIRSGKRLFAGILILALLLFLLIIIL